MILAWSLCNVLFTVVFLYACWRVGRFLKGHVGTATTIVFMLGLLVVGCKRDQPVAGPAKNLIAPTTALKQPANSSAIAHQPIDASHTLLVLSEYQHDDKGIQPRGLFVTVSGFMLGHTWSAQDGMLNVVNNTLQYEAFVQHDWSLLGIVLYSNMEEYTGQMPIKAKQTL